MDLSGLVHATRIDVVPENAVGDRDRSAGEQVQPAAVRSGGVSKERAVGQRGGSAGHHPGPEAGRVSCEQGVRHFDGTGLRVDCPAVCAAADACVVQEATVVDEGTAVLEEHACRVERRIVLNGAVCNGWRSVIDQKPATTAIEIGAVAASAGDREAVDTTCRIDIRGVHHVIAVVGSVSRDPQVAGQDCEIGGRGTLVSSRFATREAAINRDIVEQNETRAAVIGVSLRDRIEVRPVGATRDPDFRNLPRSQRCRGECGLEFHECVEPVGAVAKAQSRRTHAHDVGGMVAIARRRARALTVSACVIERARIAIIA